MTIDHDQLPFEFRELHAQSQTILIVLLNTDLDLGTNMLHSAHIESDFGPARTAAVQGKVREIVRSVRSLTGRIEDRTKWATVHDRTNKLEAKLAEQFGG